MTKQAKQNEVQVRSLISISPKLYEEITNKLAEEFHIHTYDLQVNAAKKVDGIHVYLKFGEHFSHEKDKFFTHDMIEDGKTLEAFIKDVGEACKEVMIEDYFNKMTP